MEKDVKDEVHVWGIEEMIASFVILHVNDLKDGVRLKTLTSMYIIIAGTDCCVFCEGKNQDHGSFYSCTNACL